MTTDVNLCTKCGWSETEPDLNPHRQKCPECGSTYEYREEVRFFT